MSIKHSDSVYPLQKKHNNWTVAQGPNSCPVLVEHHRHSSNQSLNWRAAKSTEHSALTRPNITTLTLCVDLSVNFILTPAQHGVSSLWGSVNSGGLPAVQAVKDICRPCLSRGRRSGELMRFRWTLSTSPWWRVPLTESSPEGKPPWGAGGNRGSDLPGLHDWDRRWALQCELRQGKTIFNTFSFWGFW